jgi:hypothetical protein
LYTIFSKDTIDNLVKNGIIKWLLHLIEISTTNQELKLLFDMVEQLITQYRSVLIQHGIEKILINLMDHFDFQIKGKSTQLFTKLKLDNNKEVHTLLCYLH